MASLTDDLCSAVVAELRRRAQAIDSGRGSIIKVTVTLRLELDTGHVRGIAVEDDRLYKRGQYEQRGLRTP